MVRWRKAKSDRRSEYRLPVGVSLTCSLFEALGKARLKAALYVPATACTQRYCARFANSEWMTTVLAKTMPRDYYSLAVRVNEIRRLRAPRVLPSYWAFGYAEKNLPLSGTLYTVLRSVVSGLPVIRFPV